MCRKSLTPFRDMLSYKEACITVRCQACQDGVDFNKVNSQGTFSDGSDRKWCQKGLEIDEPCNIRADQNLLASKNISVVNGQLKLN